MTKKKNHGGIETVALNEVPGNHFTNFLKRLQFNFGDGLYGWTLKQKGEHVYIIEVNDNVKHRFWLMKMVY